MLKFGFVYSKRGAWYGQKRRERVFLTLERICPVSYRNIQFTCGGGGKQLLCLLDNSVTSKLTVRFEITWSGQQSLVRTLWGPVYTGPDKFLPGQRLARFHFAFTRDRRNWTNFWTAKWASLGPDKNRSTFWPARFWFRTNPCKPPNRVTFCSDSVVEAWNLVMLLPGYLAKVKPQSKNDWS